MGERVEFPGNPKPRCQRDQPALIMTLPCIRIERHIDADEDIERELRGMEALVAYVEEPRVFVGVDYSNSGDLCVEVCAERMSDGSIYLKAIQVLPSGL